MLKPLMIFRLAHARRVDDLTDKICTRRLDRRQRSAGCDPDILADHRVAVENWRSATIKNRQHESADLELSDFFKAVIEPRLTDHPRYPRLIHPRERSIIRGWVEKRFAKSAPPLPAKLPAAERDELLAAACSMQAVYMSEHEIDVAFSHLHEQYPWMSRLNETAWRQAARRARAGLPTGCGPLLLLGPPGLGKSSWSRSLAAALRVPELIVDAGQTGGVMDLQGCARGWGSAERGRLMSTFISTKIANPVVLVDELDAGSLSAGTKTGSLPGIFKVLLGMIEPSSASAWMCPYFQTPVDISHVTWIATSNTSAGIPGPLIDRMTVIEVQTLTFSQIADFARKAAANRLEEAEVELIVSMLKRQHKSGTRVSLRQVLRAVNRMCDASQRPILH